MKLLLMYHQNDMKDYAQGLKFAKSHNILSFKNWYDIMQVQCTCIKTIYCCGCADDINEAYNLIKDLEPTTPQEYILKGVVNAALGQEQGSVSDIHQLTGSVTLGSY